MGVFRCVRIWLLVHVTSTISQLQAEIGCALAMEGIHVQGSMPVQKISILIFSPSFTDFVVAFVAGI